MSVALDRMTAQFECGCWFHEVGCVRHPPIEGVMCCPVHKQPYKSGIREQPHVDLMCALELALDVAFHDGDPRDLAVAAQAWLLAGYSLETIDVSHGGGDIAIRDKVSDAFYGRRGKLLKADARGLLMALTMLTNLEILPCRVTNEVKRQRWLARGGHDR